MKIRDIRKPPAATLQVVRPDQTIHEAIRLLSRLNIGAVPVVDHDGTLVGIVSERDVLRLCAHDDCASRLTLNVSEVMTRDLIVGVPDDSLDYVMRVMTERRVRHIPVLEDRRLVAIVSIGDVVKALYDARETEVRYLRDYLHGGAA